MTSIDWQIVSDEYLMECAARGDRKAAEILWNLLADRLTGGTAADLGSDTISKARVVIGVCTAMRPQILLRCLESIALQIVPAGLEVHLVVVDNEAEPNNRRLVHDLSARCQFPVHYVHEPRSGIPQARNVVIEKACELAADWLAFTDDDCWVSPLWLVTLLAAAKRHDADVVCGRREFVLPSTFWARPAENPRCAEGERLHSAATYNVLLAAWLVADDGRGRWRLRFDERLTHGEDTDFFYRAGLLRARIVYSHKAVAFETVSPERTKLHRQVSRAYYYAASRSYFHRRHKGFGTAFVKVLDRLVLKTPAAVVRLSIAPFVWPFSEDRFKSLVVKGAGRLAGLAGATAGLMGFPGNPYKAIDQA